MNIEEVKKRLNKFQNNKQSYNKDNSDYLNAFWKPKPEDGKQLIRIVPYKFNKDYVFSELYFHFNVGKTRMLALTNFGESDPIVELVNELRKNSDAEMKELAKKLAPKLRIFAPIVVRGEENKGVRFWEFGKQVYQELLGVMMDEDYGDITDVVKGRDITVEVISAKETGKMYPTTTIRVKPKQVPLSEDADQVEKMLNTQVNIKEFFTKYSFEDMKESLQKYLNIDNEEVSEEKKDIQYTKSNAKKTVDHKIDELFD
jgi:hypothetical protein